MSFLRLSAKLINLRVYRSCLRANANVPPTKAELETEGFGPF
jgi:hypothetical protein